MRADEPRLHMMLGTLEFADGNAEEALRHLDVVAAAEPRLPGLHNKLGEVYLVDEAIRSSSGGVQEGADDRPRQPRRLRRTGTGKT